MPVFRADQVRPFAEGAPIGNHGRPWHGEDAWILDGEMELQHLAAVIGVETVLTDSEILFGVAGSRFSQEVLTLSNERLNQPTRVSGAYWRRGPGRLRRPDPHQHRLDRSPAHRR